MAKAKEAKVVAAAYAVLPSKALIIEKRDDGSIHYSGVTTEYQARTAAHARDPNAKQIDPKDIALGLGLAAFQDEKK